MKNKRLKGFAEYYLTETVGEKGLQYENLIYTNIIKAKVAGLTPGTKPSAGFSNVGAGDIEATYQGKPFNVEVKSSKNDQMGGGSFRYDYATKQFSPAKAMDPDDLNLLLSAAKGQVEAIDKYIEAARKIKPTKYHQQIAGVPLKISKDGRDELQQRGLLGKINKNIITDAGFIVKHYNRKGVFYIQVGGAGLFYMGSNPLKLPVPELSGEIQVEFRLGYGGSKLWLPTDPPTEARTAGLRLQGRLRTKNTSPYSLDKIEDIKKLFKR